MENDLDIFNNRKTIYTSHIHKTNGVFHYEQHYLRKYLIAKNAFIHVICLSLAYMPNNL